MSNYSRILGDVVKQARERANLTQKEVAEAADIDTRTVLNIENYKGNPKLEVLYPLIRILNIDAREIFNPELKRQSITLSELRILIEECSEEEAKDLLPILKSVLAALKSKNSIDI